MSTKDAAEQVALATTPVPVGVTGMTFIGITVEEWVMVGTAVLVVFQILVYLPKVRDAIRSLFTKEKRCDCSERAS